MIPLELGKGSSSEQDGTRVSRWIVRFTNLKMAISGSDPFKPDRFPMSFQNGRFPRLFGGIQEIEGRGDEGSSKPLPIREVIVVGLSQ